MREADSRFIDLAMLVLKVEAEFVSGGDYDNDKYCCPFCYEKMNDTEKINEKEWSQISAASAMKRIEHDAGCAYRIATDLASPIESRAALLSSPPSTPPRPCIVCLCGSTRFMDAFQASNLRETIAGRIVLSVGCNTKSDADLLILGDLTVEAKAALDELHKRKIDLADEILVLNVGGYIGESTRSEIAYAKVHGKSVRYLESNVTPPSAEAKV
jgi:hypothetical protein